MNHRIRHIATTYGDAHADGYFWLFALDEADYRLRLEIAERYPTKPYHIYVLDGHTPVLHGDMPLYYEVDALAGDLPNWQPAGWWVDELGRQLRERDYEFRRSSRKGGIWYWVNHAFDGGSPDFTSEVDCVFHAFRQELLLSLPGDSVCSETRP